MLVRYKGQKNGCPVKLPVGLKSWGEMKTAKTVWLRPAAELPDADAIKLVELDPNNFEIVSEAERVLPENDVANNVHALIESPALAAAHESHGLELDADPKPKRSRRTKSQMAALSRAKEHHGKGHHA